MLSRAIARVFLAGREMGGCVEGTRSICWTKAAVWLAWNLFCLRTPAALVHNRIAPVAARMDRSVMNVKKKKARLCPCSLLGEH